MTSIGKRLAVGGSAVFMALFLGACSQKPETQLIGKWKTYMTLEQGKPLDVVKVFHPDGRTEDRVSREGRTDGKYVSLWGTYTVQGHTIRIQSVERVNPDGTRIKAPGDISVCRFTVEGDTLNFSIPPGQPFMFTRVSHDDK